MTLYKALLLRVDENANPEDALVAFEAQDEEDAKKRLEGLLADGSGLGWRSYADTELWGKPLRMVVSVDEWDGATAVGQRAPTRLE